MGKRIEEFTAEELYRVWAEADGGSREGFDEVLDYIKANLDTGKREPMSVEEIEKRLRSDWMTLPSVVGEMNNSLAWNGLARAIQPLTVQQGFVPDWSVADKEAKAFLGRWWSKDTYSSLEKGEFLIPRPAHKMRQKTEMEKAESWIEWKIRTHGDNEIDARESLIRRLLEGKTIDDLCRAAGIPLETAE